MTLMKRGHVIVFVCLIALGITTARAQQNHHVLLFEITKNGTVIATPELWLRDGQAGRISISEEDAPSVAKIKGLRERITVTPTGQGENMSMAFDIRSDTKQFRPTLVISRDIKGAIEWPSYEGQAIRLTVSWVN